VKKCAVARTPVRPIQVEFEALQMFTLQFIESGTVLGDVVNTASRLEGPVAQADQIVISQSTRALVGDSFQLKTMGMVTLRGRESKTEVFEVLG